MRGSVCVTHLISVSCQHHVFRLADVWIAGQVFVQNFFVSSWVINSNFRLLSVIHHKIYIKWTNEPIISRWRVGKTEMWMRKEKDKVM